MTMTSMARDIVKDNFDINVYNRGADESSILPSEQYYDEWVLCPYSLNWDGNFYNIDTELSELNLVLTDEEVKALTLGWDQNLGGDYIGEDDFWIDANSFKDTYKTIPKNVAVWLDFVTYNL